MLIMTIAEGRGYAPTKIACDQKRKVLGCFGPEEHKEEKFTMWVLQHKEIFES